MRGFLDRRGEARGASLAELHRQAQADADRIVAFIRDTYRPTRILQWGSVIEPAQFREYSDIDIALEGVTEAETFFSLLAHAEEMTEFPVDIVQLERIEPEFRELLLKKGRIVYER